MIRIEPRQTQSRAFALGVPILSAVIALGFAAIPLLAATMFAVYGLLTRYVARADTTATSFFWTGTMGAIAMTLVGVWFWEPMTGTDWLYMGCLCITGVTGLELPKFEYGVCQD